MANNLSSAAGSNLTGQAYFQNLAQKGNPQEQKAATGWLARNSQNSQNSNALVPGQFGGAIKQIGIKTKSTTDTQKPPINTTSQPQVQTPQGGGNTTDGGTQQNYGTPPPPAGGMGTPPQNQQQQQYQPNDNGLYGKLVADLANRSQQSGKDYQDAKAEAQRISNQQTGVSQDYAQKTNNIAGTAGFLTQQAGLQGQLNNQYNTVENSLASQYSGATNRLNAANTQQGLLQQALTSAAGAAAPQSYSLYNQPYNPVSDTYGGGGSNGAIDRSIQAANIGTAGSFAGDYQNGLAKLRVADSIQNQVLSTLKNNPTLNNTPVSAITNLNEFLSGQSSQSGQQLLSQQVNNYIQTLGLDPASVVNIAHQQSGTLAQLLDSLRQTVQNQVNAKNPANVKSNSGSSGTSIKSNKGNSYNLPY